MKNKKKYKFNSGIQQIEMDTPDYDKAYNLKAEENAQRQGIVQGLGAVSGTYKSVADVGSIAGNVIRNRAKNKEKGYALGGAVEMGSTGAAFGANIGQKIGGPFGLAIGAGAGALAGGIYGAVKGKKEYIKGKKLQEDAEKKTAWDNYFKGYNPNGSETDAQAMLAKKGKRKIKSKKKYKVVNKQPRLIETEGREPIFSPKKSDGTRDLLYYNPNDPTHEEGGVKAMVVPKAQGGKQKTKAAPKAAPITLPGMKRPAGESDEWNPGEIRDPAKRQAPTLFRLSNPTNEAWRKNYRKEDSAIEDMVEIVDPTGITSHDDLQRQIELQKNFPTNASGLEKGLVGAGTAGSVLAAAPLIGKSGVPFKLTRELISEGLKRIPATKNLAKYVYKAAQDVTPAAKGIWGHTKKWAKWGINSGFKTMDEFQDYIRGFDAYNQITNKESDKRSDKNLQDLIREKKAYGAKQLKVNDLNNTAFSQNLSNTPSPNAANAFIQPQAEINQVARQIPQERRQETINTKRSHKKSVGPIKTVEPPMLYEMKPPPPKSTFNTKNDFIDGTRELKSNKVKRTISAREQSRKKDSTMYAQNAYSAAKRMELENEGKGKNIFVTEKRSKHKNYGKKTSDNTCISAACLLNKMTGTNLPLNSKLLTDPNTKGDNANRTKRNVDFKNNHTSLGFKILKPTDKLQPGDILQINKGNTPAHAETFLGNAVGPIIGADHGNHDDDQGYDVEHRDWEGKYNTAADAKKYGNYSTVYRYMGLPKKEKGSKNLRVYAEGTDGTEPGATYKHTKTFKSKPAYQAALQAHDDSLNLYSQSRYFTDLVKGSGLYNSTVENPEVKNITRSGLGKAQSPLKAYGAPNEYTEEIMSVAGMNPMRKDLYSRKESQYKSFKEHKEAEASGQPHGTHEGYEINMYKHPEMALNFQPDTAETIQPRRTNFKTSSDSSSTAKTPVRPIQAPTKETVADTSGTKTTSVVATKPSATRGKFVGREKTLLDKASEFLNKVGSSKRKSNGKTVRVFK
jgi:hypothetical protein